MKVFTLGLGQLGATWHPLVTFWLPKKWLLYTISLFWGLERNSGVTLENSIFQDFLHFWRPRRHPSDARMTFERVLSALWRKRKSSYEGFFLMAGPARGHLAAFGGLFMVKKWVIVSVFAFMMSRMEFWCRPGKLESPRFLTFLATRSAPLATPEWCLRAF